MRYNSGRYPFNTVWMVSFDGYLENYGSLKYLVGIFNSETVANEVADKVKKKYNIPSDKIKVHQVDFNTEYEIRLNEYISSYETDIFLGGYAE